MDNVTPDMIMTFLIVAAALIGFVLLCWNLIDKIVAARRPKVDLAKWQQDIDTKLKNDNGRIDHLEKGQNVMLRGINAIIAHEINGNSVEKLSKSQEEILNYLTGN